MSVLNKIQTLVWFQVPTKSHVEVSRVFTEYVTDRRPSSPAYANRVSRGVTVVQKVALSGWLLLLSFLYVKNNYQKRNTIKREHV